MEFGERFHALRLKKGLSEDQIASFLGVSWKEITSWEKGRAEPSLPMLMKISAYFGVSTDSLLGMDRILRETLIADYLERYHTHISENRLPEAIAVMREGLLHFPDNHRLKCMRSTPSIFPAHVPPAIKHYRLRSFPWERKFFPPVQTTRSGWRYGGCFVCTGLTI